MSGARVRTFVALLRGINVSGARPVPMAGLRTGLTAGGFENVRTYLQSGNVVLDSLLNDPREVASAVRERIAEDFGEDVEVLVMPCEEMARVVSANPFLGAPGVDERWLHATFLFEAVAEAKFTPLKLPVAEGEQAAVVGGVMYLYLPHGYGRTKLSNAFFEKVCGCSTTTRNWRTVRALAEMCGAG